MNRFSKKEESLKGRLLFLFFPPKCALCGKVGFDCLCPYCRGDMEELFSPRRFLPSGGSGFVDRMVSLFPYADARVKRLLFEWKQKDFEDLEEIFVLFASRRKVRGLFPDRIDRITFLPRRPGAVRRFGHDQAKIFAKALSEAYKIPFETLLSRRRGTRTQHRMKGAARFDNMKNAFYVNKSLDGESILLVDDIVTSGAGVMECARVLKKAGAMKVFVLCLAH